MKVKKEDRKLHTRVTSVSRSVDEKFFLVQRTALK